MRLFVRGQARVAVHIRRSIVVATLTATSLALGLSGTTTAAAPHNIIVPPTVTASTWVPTTSQDPAGSQFPTPLAVSCATSTFCISVGYNSISNVSYPLIHQWNGTSWVPVTPAVAGQFDFSLNGVSCVSATFCEAVGYTKATNASPDLPLAMMWNGSTWSVQPVNLPPSQTNEVFDGVSCLSTTNCMAVGQEYNSSTFQPSSQQWSGSQWTPVPTAPVNSSSDDELFGVSCTTPTFCMAAGRLQQADDSIVVLLEMWNGGTWSIAPSSSSPPVSVISDLLGVSCTGTQFCAATGVTRTTFANQTTDRTLMELWNGTSWSVSPSPNQGGANGDIMSGVSCFAATSCSAVGWYYTDSSGNFAQNEAMTWNGLSWTEVTPANYQISQAQAGPGAELLGVSCLTNWACVAAGYATGPSGGLSWIIMSPIARSGYRFVASDGGVFNYGPGAPFLGSLGGTLLNKPIVGMAVMPAGDGYDLVGSDGGVFTYGSAQFYGSTGALHLNAPIVGMAITPDGGGYWLVASDGGIFSYGDAQFYGSTGAIHLNKPIVGMAPTPNGLGYWLVASDGGIFNYGNSPFLGSTGGLVLNKPIVGMAATTAGQYYLVASDGGIFSFPTTAGPPFFGSTGAIHLNKPIVGMTTVSGGYYLSGSDGGIFAFPPGGPPFFGSTGAIVLNRPIVALVS